MPRSRMRLSWIGARQKMPETASSKEWSDQMTQPQLSGAQPPSASGRAAEGPSACECASTSAL